MAEARRFHVVSYLNNQGDSTRVPGMHQCRDFGAVMEVTTALRRQGFEYGEWTLMGPPQSAQEAAASRGRQISVDHSFADRGDMLVLGTRPPKSEDEEQTKKRVQKAGSDLEERVFQAWHPFLGTCARSHVRLQPSVGRRLPPSHQSCRNMEFLQHRPCAPYRAEPRKQTALFLLRLDEAWPGGPGLLSFFGMAGLTTLIWGYRLGRDFAYLLEEPGFVMAELTIGAAPPTPTNLRWAMSWNIEVVLRLPLEEQLASSEIGAVAQRCHDPQPALH